ncbi:hypothetical protein Goshw_003314, partial [Gossypium schwendimanii]|nr:hypothetical protein [Gossypium schwendimanii]
ALYSYLRVEEGLWVVLGLDKKKYVIDRGDKICRKGYPSNLVIWIQFLGFLNVMYKKSLLRAIGSIIGQVVKIGYNTDSGSRGRFASLAVTVDVLKPLVSKVLINGELQQEEEVLTLEEKIESKEKREAFGLWMVGQDGVGYTLIDYVIDKGSICQMGNGLVFKVICKQLMEINGLCKGKAIEKDDKRKAVAEEFWKAQSQINNKKATKGIQMLQGLATEKSGVDKHFQYKVGVPLMEAITHILEYVQKRVELNGVKVGPDIDENDMKTNGVREDLDVR